jgi:hypothetical protein
MDAFKTQQYRWTKGSIQTAKKLLPRILKSRLPWSLKREAFFHLTSFFCYPAALVASLGLPMALTGAITVPNHDYVGSLWGALLAIPGAFFYLCGQRELHADWLRRILVIPWVLALGGGMLLNNSRAVLDGIFSRSAVFIRTPKFGLQSRGEAWQQMSYRAPMTWSVWAELALAGYFAFWCWVAYSRGLYLAMLSVGLFCVGFAYVGCLPLWQRRSANSWWSGRERVAEPSPSEMAVEA